MASSDDLPVDELVVGAINGVYGIKGWIKVYSYTSPIEQILQYQPWILCKGAKRKSIEVTEGKVQGKGVIALPKGFETRNDAESLVGYEIRVETKLLPDLPEGDFYWHELEGMKVFNESNEYLGNVEKLIETGANDVLVIQGTNESIDEQERLIPFVMEEIVKEVDAAARVIRVAWQKDY